MEEFKTIKKDIQEEIVVQKSKFICNLIRIESREDAEEKIKQLKKKYFDARHNCVAYRVFEKGQIIEKSSDDGEPSGTAGGPMLNILQKNNLSNVLAVVTRYFGGILLGTGGLVRAYSDATLKAIDASDKVGKCFGIEMEVILEYNALEIFKYYCLKNGINIVNTEYMDKIICKIELEESIKEKIVTDIEQKNINLVEYKVLARKMIDKNI